MKSVLPPLNWLKVFESAARLSSFTAAAEEIGISQSAISQQIKSLEQYLGHSLFHRAPRNIQLTESGRLYLPFVQESFGKLGHATQDIFGAAETSDVTLKVNTVFLLHWLAPRLAGFLNSHKDINLQLLNDNWGSDINSAGAEIEIRYGSGNWPGLDYTKLTVEKLVPICAPSLSKKLKQADDIFNFPLIEAIGNPIGWTEWRDQYCENKQQIAQMVYVDTSATAYAIVRAGGGLSLGREILFQSAIDQGEVSVPFPEKTLSPQQAYYLIEHPYLSKADDKVKIVRDWLSQQF